MAETRTYTLDLVLKRSATGDKTRVLEEITVVKSTQESIEANSRIIANAASDEAFDLSGIGSGEGRLIVIESDASAAGLTVKVNGTGNTGVPFTELLVISGGAVTSLHFGNATGADAQVSVYAVGAAPPTT